MKSEETHHYFFRIFLRNIVQCIFFNVFLMTFEAVIHLITRYFNEDQP